MPARARRAMQITKSRTNEIGLRSSCCLCSNPILPRNYPGGDMSGNTPPSLRGCHCCTSVYSEPRNRVADRASGETRLNVLSRSLVWDRQRGPCYHLRSQLTRGASRESAMYARLS